MSRRAALGLAGLIALASAALAQGPIVATPLPPLDGQATPEAPAPVPPPAKPAGFPDVWQPRQGATIQALDKVNARTTALTLRLGVPVTFQTLTIMLKACVVRPPDQPADAAAFSTVTDRTGDAAPLSLWLVRSAPAASMLQHPMYDVRVNACLP